MSRFKFRNCDDSRKNRHARAFVLPLTLFIASQILGCDHPLSIVISIEGGRVRFRFESKGELWRRPEKVWFIAVTNGDSSVNKKPICQFEVPNEYVSEWRYGEGVNCPGLEVNQLYTVSVIGRSHNGSRQFRILEGERLWIGTE
jgi:hypothetical protein